MELTASGLCHAYGRLPVLDGIDLTVRDGEIVVLLGPSGCGKSTLLRILGGLERPDQGRVSMAGAVPPGCRNPLTYVFQDFALLPWRTVAGNLSLVLEHHPVPAPERGRLVADALARVNLADFADAWPRQLSGGMRQRTAIARALVVNPAVLLMDEPFSALDAQTRDLLLQDFLALWRASRLTAVYVTHNIAEALRLGHRVVVLSRRPGRIREIVPIDVPLEDRVEAHPDIVAAGAHIWSLIRDEAAEADRELRHAP